MQYKNSISCSVSEINHLYLYIYLHLYHSLYISIRALFSEFFCCVILLKQFYLSRKQWKICPGSIIRAQRMVCDYIGIFVTFVFPKVHNCLLFFICLVFYIPILTFFHQINPCLSIFSQIVIWDNQSIPFSFFLLSGGNLTLCSLPGSDSCYSP